MRNNLHPLLAAAAFVILVAALHFGSPIFIPIALAIVLSLVLTPVVAFLEKRRIPRALAAILGSLLMALVFSGLGTLVTLQAVDLGRDLPKYKANIRQKVTFVLEPISRLMIRAKEEVKEAGESEKRGQKTPKEPVQVEVVDRSIGALDFAGYTVWPLLDIMATGAVVFLLVIFFLIFRLDVLDRTIALVTSAHAGLTHQAIDQAASGISRYLATLALVNGSFGLALALGLVVIGVPNPILWGILAALLRFIPYVGPMIAGILPVLLSLAVFEGWAQAILVAGLIVSLEVVCNNFIEPWAYGSRTGLSPLAVILSGIFFAWIWGPVGLILSVPIAVCLSALGKHVPSLWFLTILLDRKVPVDPLSIVHDRLICGNSLDALRLIDQDRGKKPFEEVCDSCLIPVLSRIEEGLDRGSIDEHKAGHVLDGIEQVVEDLAALYRDPTSPVNGADESPKTVLCLAAAERTDEVVGEMLVQALLLKGKSAALVNKSDLGALQPEVLCISAHSRRSFMRLRSLYREQRMRSPGLKIVIALWGPIREESTHRIIPDGNATIVTTLARAEKIIGEIMDPVPGTSKPGQ